MNLHEFLAAGHRRCQCANITLIVSMIELTTHKQRHHDPIRNLMANVILGPLYGKPRKRWQARCSQCDQLYLVDDSEKKLINLIKKAGMEMVE